MSLKFEALTGKTAEKAVEKLKVGHKFGFTKVVNENGDFQVFPTTFKRWAQSVIDFEVRPDDVFLCSFPKAGTTWAQEMIWMIGQDCDTDGAHEVLNTRFPHLEYGPAFLNSIRMSVDEELYKNEDESIQFVNRMVSPRYIKTHMAAQFLPKQIQEKKPKIIYIIRDPKDNCVSFYYFSKLFEGYTGTFEEFVELFTEGNVFCGPYWSHVKSYWNKRDEANVLIITYEDMYKDLRSVILKVAAFMDKKLNPGQLDYLFEHLSFDNMKVNPYVNYEPFVSKLKNMRRSSVPEGLHFMRKGQTGDWKNHMGPELVTKFNDWIKKNSEGTGLPF